MFSFVLFSLGKDPIMNTTLDVYGVAAVPDDKDPDMGHLVIVIEAGLMNALQLYQKEDIPLHVTYGLWSRIAAAVHVLHSKKIMHQDLKPENILITGVSNFLLSFTFCIRLSQTVTLPCWTCNIILLESMIMMM